MLFLDDPTRGIDMAAKQDIYRIIDELAAAGKGVILVSSELPELLRCSDRILVLSEGRVTAVYDANEATQEKIMASPLTRNRTDPDARHRARSVAALAGIIVLAILISPSAADGSRIFLQAGNLTDILRQVSLIGIISLAMTFVILTGGIDLSVGSILALSTALTAMFLTRYWGGTGNGAHILLAISGGGGRGGAGGRGERRGRRRFADAAVHRDAGLHDRRPRPGEVARRATRTSISGSAATWPRSSPRCSARRRS